MTSDFLRPPVDSLSVPELIAITRSEAQLMLDSQRHATERAIFLGECLRAIAARNLYRLAGARTEQDFLDSLKLAKDEATGFVEASAVPMQLVAGRRIAMDKLRILGKAADWLRLSLCPEVGPHTNAEVLRQAIVRAVSAACFDLGIDVLAEGVESVDEYGWFPSEGVSLFQGYLFGRPDFERFPAAYYPDEMVATAFA